VLGSVFAYWYFQIRPSSGDGITPPEIGIGLAISLAITFLSGLLGLQINVTENTFEIKDKVERVKDEFIEKQKEQLRSRVKIIELTGRDIDRLILEKIKDANLVRNTYVNLAEKMSRVPSSEADSVKQYNEFLSQDERHWIDITTTQDMNLGRYKKIKPRKVGIGSRHEVSIVNAQTDIINFLLIDKNNAPTDVFFGWVGESGEYFRVFWTNNQAMLEAFGGYFSSLRKASVEDIEIDYKGGASYRSQSDMLIGRWVCVPQIERMTRTDIFKTYSILDISMSNGKWMVRSEVFKAANKQRIRVIESDMAMSHGSSLFFEGISRSVGGTQRTITFGQFKVAPDYDDMLIGTYVAEDATTVSRLFAYRADEKIEGTDFQKITPIMKKIIDRPDLVRAEDWNLDPPSLSPALTVDKKGENQS